MKSNTPKDKDIISEGDFDNLKNDQLTRKRKGFQQKSMTMNA